MKLRFVFTIAISVVVAIVIGSAAFAYWSTQTAIHESVRTLKFAVTKDLHDPESARFRSVQLRSLDGLIRERVKLLDIAFFRRSTPEQVLAVFRYNPETFLLCGELNAKNAFGAYVGYKYFYATALRGEPHAVIDAGEDDHIAKRMCEIGEKSVVFAEPDAK